ncbi:hypothetical protein SOVF_175940 [Spinacia oleracea]|nr:hypothetical protein SOVF_175940 [Spinacia oleracea]
MKMINILFLVLLISLEGYGTTVAADQCPGGTTKDGSGRRLSTINPGPHGYYSNDHCYINANSKRECLPRTCDRHPSI